jgi:TRAP-type mannitol/chloroaromatic compound transport system permease large subunit
MRTVGVITTGVAGVVAAIVLAIGIRSVPDMRRYLRIRSM